MGEGGQSTRRKFIKALSAVGLGAGGLGLFWWDRGGADPGKLHEVLYEDARSVRRVASAIADALNPDPGEVDHVSADLRAAFDRLSQDQDRFKAFVEEEVRKDFDRENTVRVFGWMLSRYECMVFLVVAGLVADGEAAQTPYPAATTL